MCHLYVSRQLRASRSYAQTSHQARPHHVIRSQELSGGRVVKHLPCLPIQINEAIFAVLMLIPYPHIGETVVAKVKVLAD